MVVYLIVVQGQSYTEAQLAFKHQYNINLSNGEIARILAGESRLLTPYYNHLIDTLTEQPAHYDETTWKTKSQGKTVAEGNYCWVKIAVNNNNRLIWFGKGRGKKLNC